MNIAINQSKHARHATSASYGSLKSSGFSCTRVFLAFLPWLQTQVRLTGSADTLPLIGGLLWHMVLLPPSRDPNVNLTVRDSYSSRSTLLVMLVTTLVLLAGEAAAGRSDASAD